MGLHCQMEALRYRQRLLMLQAHRLHFAQSG
jgi:hypothetical protein